MPAAIPDPASADTVTGAADTETVNVSPATPNGQLSGPVRTTHTLCVRPEVPEDAAQVPSHIPAVVHILDPEIERPGRAGAP